MPHGSEYSYLMLLLQNIILLIKYVWFRFFCADLSQLKIRASASLHRKTSPSNKQLNSPILMSRMTSLQFANYLLQRLKTVQFLFVFPCWGVFQMKNFDLSIFNEIKLTKNSIDKKFCIWKDNEFNRTLFISHFSYTESLNQVFYLCPWSMLP